MPVFGIAKYLLLNKHQYHSYNRVNMVAVEQVLEVLAESLNVPEDLYEQGDSAQLLGAIPELD